MKPYVLCIKNNEKQTLGGNKCIIYENSVLIYYICGSILQCMQLRLAEETVFCSRLLYSFSL